MLIFKISNMRTYREQALRNHISNKGILLTKQGKRLFKQFDYYQVINGYKYLFIDSVEDLDVIKRKILSTINSHAVFYADFFHINRYSSNQDLYTKVCHKICNKYGISVGKNPTLAMIENEIKSIGYVRHVFDPNSNYDDFVRMYLFEHELRNVLLKYVLFIEERIKKVFISTLNNMNVDANCLADISNYDLSRTNKNKALGSLGKIIAMHSNKNSKPILHKMEQELTVPYWIIVNEMTLKQTLITANCLMDSMSEKIKQALTNELTLCNYDIFDSSKSRNQIKREKKSINRFIDILFHLADFRNHLAHNQPVYCYNVKKHFPLQWDMPHLDKKHPNYNPNQPYVSQQRQINLPLLNATIDFFGQDVYNQRNNATPPFDINLSWIIYLINRIVNVIVPKNNMKTNICDLYKKYNIVLSYSPNEYYGNINSTVVSFLTSGKTVGKETRFNTTKLNRLLKKMANDQKTSVFSPFGRAQAYYSYTNIDANFLINILC